MLKVFSIASLALELQACKTLDEKLCLLNEVPQVSESLSRNIRLSQFLNECALEEQVILKVVLAIGQGHLFEVLRKGGFKKGMKCLLSQIISVERFYHSIGGIAGYQARMLELLSARKPSEGQEATYYPAEGLDISFDSTEVRQAILEGIIHLPEMAEIYPVGGAADRLRLYDEKTGVALPAARLQFLGRSLLAGMVFDLQSREYLYYKLFGKQIVTPLAMMTSQEKDNHRHILAICQESRWFGRPKKSFRFFCQPSVPTVTRTGQWCQIAPMQLFLKPGGHGVMWRLAQDCGIFEWFYSYKRRKVLIRQINNPVANTDHGILAFTGLGCKEDKVFGFASCLRQVKASEGVNVVIEKRQGSSYDYVLTNIEYCDFKKFGIVDQPVKSGSLYSKFSSNTNILFADLNAISEAVEKCPIPGTLVNLKKITYHTENGEKKEEEIARLESTMQNIADLFIETHQAPLPQGQRRHLKTFLTYNERRKTISAAKREFTLGASLLETPEGCFLDILKNARELLQTYCQLQVPEVSEPASFFSHGPSFIFLYHPALGPLYSLIAQKLRKGVLHPGSELQLEIAEADIENLELQGSLLIRAKSVMGHLDQKGILNYSEKSGKCTLKAVKVSNRGIDFEASNIYWKNEITREEACEIVLHGSGEFHAENVTLKGAFSIEVKDGEKVTLTEERGEIKLSREPLSKPTWFWKYSINQDNALDSALSLERTS